MGRIMGERAWVLLVVLALGLPGCYPGEITSAVESDVVVTFQDVDADFQANRTFVLPDSVVELADTLSGGRPIEIDRRFDPLILATVRENLLALGYVEEPDPVNVPPDVVVLVGVTASENWEVYVSYPWWDRWGWYPGWGFFPGFGPGWGLTYPWLPIVGATVYQTGSILIDMLEPDRRVPDASVVPSIWLGAVAGVLQPDPEIGAARITGGIDQAFRQSPYLRVR